MGLSGQFRTGWPGQMDFLSSPTWKRQLHYNYHHRVGMRTDGLPSIWQDHTWLCLQLLLFAIIVLSILHLLVPFILHNYSMTEILLFSISQIGNWDREVRSLAQGHTAGGEGGGSGTELWSKPGPRWNKDRKGAERGSRATDVERVVTEVQWSPVGFHPLRVRDQAPLGAHTVQREGKEQLSWDLSPAPPPMSCMASLSLSFLFCEMGLILPSWYQV